MKGHDSNIHWDKDAKEKFEQMTARIPVFLRDIAQKAVLQKAQDLVRKENRLVIAEKDLIDAFFAATPFGFHGPMKTDMTSCGIDYVRYGYPT